MNHHRLHPGHPDAGDRRLRATIAGRAGRLAATAMDTCTLAGLTHVFPLIVEVVWDDAHDHGGGINQTNTHPLAALRLTTMTELAGLMPNNDGGDAIHRAVV